ncbi:hypothetical protein SANA_23020 [Gottschalkiaceae bacterium SANA]|nr:hypothetical protein SANA_23020 [Gottschalkiaceae bacterium SANA]
MEKKDKEKIYQFLKERKYLIHKLSAIYNNDYDAQLVKYISSFKIDNIEENISNIISEPLRYSIKRASKVMGIGDYDALNFIFYAILRGHIRLRNLHDIEETFDWNEKNVRDLDFKIDKYMDIRMMVEKMDGQYLDEETYEAYTREELLNLIDQHHIIDCISDTSDVESYTSTNLSSLSITEFGEKYYFFIATKNSLDHINRMISENDMLKNQALQAQNKTSESVEKMKNIEERIIKIESNLFLYMSVFIAIFSLLGINFNYVSTLINNGSYGGVIVLNGSIIVTIIVIFTLIDFIQISSKVSTSTEYRKIMKFRRKNYLYLVIAVIGITWFLASILN